MFVCGLGSVSSGLKQTVVTELQYTTLFGYGNAEDVLFVNDCRDGFCVTPRRTDSVLSVLRVLNSVVKHATSIENNQRWKILLVLTMVIYVYLLTRCI